MAARDTMTHGLGLLVFVNVCRAEQRIEMDGWVELKLRKHFCH